MQRLTAFLIALFIMPLVGFKAYVPAADRVEVVILDPGHGGKDPGNIGTGRYHETESDVALDVTLKVAKLIKEAHPKVKVVLTRDKDDWITLHDRTIIANDNKGDVFISIHCNAATSEHAHGTESFVMGKNHGDENQVALRENSVILMEDNFEATYEGFDPRKPESYIALTLFQYAFQHQSIELAQTIQDAFRMDVGRKDRGVKQQPLYVTSRTSMPSVLVELGFLTHNKEEDYLQSAKGQDELALAIATAFTAYKVKRERQSNGSAAGHDTSEETTEEAPQEEEIKEPDTYGFYIQLSVSSQNKPLDEPPFDQLSPVVVKKDGRLYRYLHGPFTQWDVAIAAQADVRSKGFPDAFVVSYLGDRRVSHDEAKAALN